MKRFLLSLAIIVMACGSSFGQGGAGGAGGTGGTGGTGGSGGSGGTNTNGAPSSISLTQTYNGYWLPNLVMQQINEPHPFINPYRGMTGRVMVWGNYAPLCNNKYVKNHASHLPDAGTHLAAFPGMYPTNNPNYTVIPHSQSDVKTTPYFKGEQLIPEDPNSLRPQLYKIQTTVVISDLSFDDAKTEVARLINLLQDEAEASRDSVTYNHLDGTQTEMEWEQKTIYFPQTAKDTVDSFDDSAFHCTPLPNGKFKVQAHYIVAIHLPYDMMLNLTGNDKFFIQPE